MDREKKEIAKIPLPDAKKVDETETVYVMVAINYRKDARGGRGYYYSALIGREKPTPSYEDPTKTITIFSWICFQNSKSYLLETAPRFNEKKLASLTLTDEQIEQVRAEAVASIRS